MKNVLLVINIVLILLVGYLYFFIFSGKKAAATTHAEKVTVSESEPASQKSRIAYIDLDSLQAQYGYYQKIKTDFEKKQNAANNEIMSLQRKFQNRTAELQQKANTMTPEQQEKAMMEINKMQQDFQTRKETLDKNLFDYNSKMKDDILDKIETFLKTYNKDGRYSYIFSYEPGFMFYKDSTLNITKDVVEGLNADYSDKENK